MVAPIRKGENLLMPKDFNESRDIHIQIKWKVKNNISVEVEEDIDASIFLVGSNESLISNQDFIFYNDGINQDKLTFHDNSVGDQSDGEKFIVHLNGIPEEIQKLVCCFTLYGWKGHHQKLKDVLESLAIELINHIPSNHVLVQYNLTHDIQNETALILGEFYRYHQDWGFRAIGEEFSGSLKSLARSLSTS